MSIVNINVNLYSLSHIYVKELTDNSEPLPQKWLDWCTACEIYSNFIISCLKKKMEPRRIELLTS